jgi:AcrR family transcriptional regulator
VLRTPSDGGEAPNESSLRERKKAATRRAISEAAFELVASHGLSGVTVEAISDKAGVAPRTFWSYFSSKEEAVVGHDPHRPESLAQALLDRPAPEDPITALRHVLEEDMTRRWPDPQTSHLRYELIHSNPHLLAAAAAMFDELERRLVSALSERLGSEEGSDLFPGVIVSAACGAFRVAHRRWSDPDNLRGLRDLLDEAFFELGRGLALLSEASVTS